MTNFLHAKYDSSGNQIDDPSDVVGQPEFAVDSTGNVTGLVGPAGTYNIMSGLYGRKGAFIGDSITALNDVCGRTFIPSAVTGVELKYAELSTSAGNATLAWNAANRTLTWTAPGDTAGAPVVVTDGIFTLQSGTAGNSVRAGVTSRALPVANQTDTIASGTVFWTTGPSFAWAADALTWGAFAFDNYGIGGNQTPDITNRYNQVLNGGYNVIIDFCGANDLGGYTGAQIAANRAANWDKALARGIPVIAVLISARYANPSTDYTVNYSAAKQNTLTAANLEIVRQARARRGVYLVDAFSTMAVQSTGLAKSNYTSDGLHTGGPMGYEIGKQIAAILRSIFPIETVRPYMSVGTYYDATYRPGGNLMTSNQGGFSGTGGTAGTGVTVGTGLAQNWQAARTSGSTMAVTANKYADPDGGPDWQEFVVATPAAVDGENFWLYPYSISSNFSAGDVINFGVEFKVVGMGCYGVYMDLNHTGGALGGSSARARQFKDLVQGLRDGETGFIRCLPHKLPNGVTALLPVIQFQGKASGTFTIRFRCAEVHKVL